MRQIILDFGVVRLFGWQIPLRVYGYGLMLVLGLVLAIALAHRLARRAGENTDAIVPMGMLALVSGVVGARLAFVIEQWDSQFADATNQLGAILNVSSGGLIYYGGVALASVVVLIYIRVKALPTRRCLDIVAPALMVGLAFGRAGCTLNGCCFGGVCREDWALAMRFPMFSKPLIKLDGRGNPFPEGIDPASSAKAEARCGCGRCESPDRPTPVYAEQLRRGLVRPDERLLADGAPVRALRPGHLHGKLDRPQLATFLLGKERAKDLFAALAGGDGVVDYREWLDGLRAGDGFLRGSEQWEDADADLDGRVTFEEAWQYLVRRNVRLGARADGRLTAEQIQQAEAYLQADLIALADGERSLPVRPAQLLGMVNALLLAGILTAFYRLRRREGQVFAVLMILYPITRFVLESIRADNSHDVFRGVLTHNQWTSLATLLAGAALLAVLAKLPPSAGPVWAERLARAAPGPTRRRRSKAAR
jgi:prolipoprotein diacylglyceryltransferase